MLHSVWYHTAIIDLFRPFVGRDLTLQSFSTPDSTPEMVCEASLTQLKSLLVVYRLSQPSALYSMLWHTSLLYVGNSVLGKSSPDVDWRFYFDICVASYLELSCCYRITSGFLQGLVVIGVRNGLVEKSEAKHILDQLTRKSQHLHAPSSAVSAHIVDLELAITDNANAQIDALAGALSQIRV